MKNKNLTVGKAISALWLKKLKPYDIADQLPIMIDYPHKHIVYPNLNVLFQTSYTVHL